MEDKRIDKDKLKELRGELMQKYGIMRRQNIEHTKGFGQNQVETKDFSLENSDEQEIVM